MWTSKPHSFHRVRMPTGARIKRLNSSVKRRFKSMWNKFPRVHRHERDEFSVSNDSYDSLLEFESSGRNIYQFMNEKNSFVDSVVTYCSEEYSVSENNVDENVVIRYKSVLKAVPTGLPYPYDFVNVTEVVPEEVCPVMKQFQEEESDFKFEILKYPLKKEKDSFPSVEQDVSNGSSSSNESSASLGTLKSTSDENADHFHAFVDENAPVEKLHVEKAPVKAPVEKLHVVKRLPLKVVKAGDVPYYSHQIRKIHYPVKSELSNGTSKVSVNDSVISKSALKDSSSTTLSPKTSPESSLSDGASQEKKKVVVSNKEWCPERKKNSSKVSDTQAQVESSDPILSAYKVTRAEFKPRVFPKFGEEGFTFRSPYSVPPNDEDLDYSDPNNPYYFDIKFYDSESVKVKKQLALDSAVCKKHMGHTILRTQLHSYEDDVATEIVFHPESIIWTYNGARLEPLERLIVPPKFRIPFFPRDCKPCLKTPKKSFPFDTQSVWQMATCMAQGYIGGRVAEELDWASGKDAKKLDGHKMIPRNVDSL